MLRRQALRPPSGISSVTKNMRFHINNPSARKVGVPSKSSQTVLSQRSEHPKIRIPRKGNEFNKLSVAEENMMQRWVECREKELEKRSQDIRVLVHFYKN